MRIWGKKMNKKLLLGSILVLTLLLLMPSIPAIQQKTIEDKVYSDLVEQLDFKDIKELVDSGKLDDIKHLWLYLFVTNRLLFKGKLFTFAAKRGVGTYKWTIWIKRPVWFVISLVIYIDFGARALFWYYISETFRWNWNLEEALRQDP